MKHKLKLLSAVLLTAVVVPAMLTVPAFARNGDDSPVTVSPTPTSTPKATASPTPTNRKAELEKEVKSLTESEVKTRIDGINAKAQQTVKELEAKKDAAKTRTEAERIKFCESKSTELNSRLNKKVSDAEKHKAVFDKIFVRVTAFHDSKQLTTADYERLVTKATSAQQAAGNSIATLKSFDGSVDCSNVGAAATKLAAFKEVLTQTRDSLKAYRTELKNLTVAVKASVPEPTTAATPTPTQTNQNSGN